MKRRLAKTLFYLAASGLALVGACATGQPASPPSGASEGGLLEASDAATAPADAGADSAPIVCSGDSGPDNDGAVGLNGCPQAVDGGPPVYIDRTCATSTTLQWNFNIATDPNRCTKIKAGSTVTWAASPSFATHPVDAFGGDSPNPIANAFADAGTSNTITLTFTQPGTYGFHCDNHSSMQGAIQVVP